MGGDPAGNKHADLIHRKIIVDLIIWGRYIGLISFGVAIAALHHQRQRNRWRTITVDVAVEFELTPVIGERRPIGHRMALLAGMAGLLCKTGKRQSVASK